MNSFAPKYGFNFFGPYETLKIFRPLGEAEIGLQKIWKKLGLIWGLKCNFSALWDFQIQKFVFFDPPYCTTLQMLVPSYPRFFFFFFFCRTCETRLLQSPFPGKDPGRSIRKKRNGGWKSFPNFSRNFFFLRLKISKNRFFFPPVWFTWSFERKRGNLLIFELKRIAKAKAIQSSWETW